MGTVLVTGGAGFIGSHLAWSLIEDGAAVRVLDNFSSGIRDRLAQMAPGVDLVEGDVRDVEACQRACRGVDAVFHMAALVSVPQSVADPATSEAINTGGTLNMLLAARDAGVRRFVFSSSAAVYGDTATIPTPESALPMPASPYGVQKLTGEHYARNFCRLFGLETVALRYFNVYGPGQDPSAPYAAAIPKFLARLLRGEPAVVFGTGEQTRDFCYVGDVVAANRLAAAAPSEAAGGVYNIGGGGRISLNRLLAMIGDALDVRAPVRYEPPRDGDILHSGADIRLAGERLGYHPTTSLECGLRETAAYYRSMRPR
ncbi:MAG TPA: NAD-dependent epimerase/dehydratase family protein [Chthonomonadaceae bacterium]|nr:NAD-dependent epimerase/dehydratase family protein [Chthonomonadaceae bacterium]